MVKQTWTGTAFVVWGLGKQGVAAARYLLRRGARVAVVDRAAEAAHAETLARLRALGSVTFWGEGATPASWTGWEAVLVSPGVPYDIPPLVEARAAGVSTVTPLDFAAQQTEIPMVAVTGSAGKSTTVSLVGEMLKASELSCFVGGNLGVPLLDALDQELAAERLVIECSSFQLEASSHLRPLVAVLTNLGENHLDRHGTMERYAACKARLFSFLPAESWVVARANDPWVDRVIAGTSAQVVRFYPEGEAEVGAMTIGGDLVLRHPLWGEERIPWSALALRGGHNRENAMAAALAARFAGAHRDGVQAGMAFAGLPHRLELLGEWQGVRYVNDSKATTPAAAAQSMLAFEPVTEPLRVLLGGRAKGNRFDAINAALGAGVKRIYLFGEAAATIASDLQTLTPTSIHTRMEDALETAYAEASPGDVVLLSPACASFDQFANFEARGDCFRAWFQRLSEGSDG